MQRETNNKALAGMNRTTSCFFSVLLLWCLSATSALAGSTRDLGMQALLNKADLVAYGRFSTVDSEWRGNKIFTIGTFDIARVFKGSPQDSVVIEYLGGTAVHPRLGAPVTMRSSEGISFSRDEEAVLLLRRNNDGIYQIIGLNRGKIPVITAADGEKQLQNMRRIQPSRSAGDNAVTIGSKPMNLDEFAVYASSLIRTGSDNQ